MMNRKEIDKLNMEQQLQALGKCHKYVPTQTCVNGENMQKFKNITLKDCQQKCSNTRGCKGIEYFRASGADTAVDDYEENDCNLSSGLDPTNCTPDKWQMWLWVKKKRMECKEWKDQHFENVVGKSYASNTSNNTKRPTTNNRRNRGGD